MGTIHTKMSHQVSKAVVWNMLVNTIWSRVDIHRILKTSFSFIQCPVSVPASDWLTTTGSDTHYKLISARFISQWRSQPWVDCCDAPIWPSSHFESNVYCVNFVSAPIRKYTWVAHLQNQNYLVTESLNLYETNGHKNPNNSHHYHNENHDEIDIYQGNS